MEGQQHDIDGPRLLQILENLVAQPLIDGPHNDAARLRVGAKALDDLPVARLGQPAPDMELDGGVIGLLACGIAMGHETFFESPNAGGNGREGVGLGIEPGDEEFHGDGSWL